MSINNGQTTTFRMNAGTPVQLSQGPSQTLTSTPILGTTATSNNSRHGVMIFVNDSTMIIDVYFGSGGSAAIVVPNGGIPVAFGAPLVFGAYDRNKLPLGDVWAVVRSGTVNGLVSITDWWD